MVYAYKFLGICRLKIFNTFTVIILSISRKVLVIITFDDEIFTDNQAITKYVKNCVPQIFFLRWAFKHRCFRLERRFIKAEIQGWLFLVEIVFEGIRLRQS